jgi:penicillin-binding protein 1A
LNPRSGRPRRQPPRPRGRPVAEYHPRRRRQRRHERSARRRRNALLAFLLVLVVSVVLVGAAITGAAALGSGCDLDSLQPVAIGQNSFVYAADGSLLGSIPAERNRTPVPLKTMSRWLPKATIAIEDRRFYEHGGVDAEGVARALWEDVKAGKVVQGGSTITQQLVRNLYPVSRERTLDRKVKEACLAIKLNRVRSKEWILAAYMNQVYYGNHAYGVEAAAQTYFSKKARNLSLVEAAMLAGLPQAPSTYDPFEEGTRALTRRNEVLGAMLSTGAITRAEYDQAVGQPIRLRPGKLYTRIHEPYFFGYVREELIKEYGATTVRSGGLKVYTTIDRRFQRIARTVMNETFSDREDPAAALVSINPDNGAIRAMTAVIPGRKKNQFNLAAQARRQAGSTFKTYVLTAALAEGISPNTTYLSAPFMYNPAGDGSCDVDPPTAWCPETYDHSYVGPTSIASATLRSDNTVYARLTLDVGPDKVGAMARKLGIRSPLTSREGDYVPSLGLGSADVSPLDMASAYATLAARGVYSQPRAINKVEFPDGKVDSSWAKVKRRRVIPDGVAYEVTRILEQNIQYGTGTAAALSRPAAGKTGTTENHSDAWFCGYTPNLSTTVWVGYPQRQIPMLYQYYGSPVAGGTWPAVIWGRYMREALKYSPPQSWQEPTQWASSFDHDLQYAMSGAIGGWDDTSDETSDDTSEEEESDEEETEETPAPPPPPPPANPAPPPPAAEPPPPPPPVEPPPPPPPPEPPPPPPPPEPPPPPPPPEPPPPAPPPPPGPG